MRTPHGCPSLTRLHANEAPWRPTGDTTAAGLNRYPEPQPRALIERLAALYGVPQTSVLATRGSDEAIDLLSRIYLRAGSRCHSAMHADLRHVPSRRAHSGRRGGRGPARPRARVGRRPRAACSPRGSRTSSSCTCARRTIRRRICSTCGSLEELCKALDGKAIVVIDEAYIEWSRSSSLTRWLNRFPTLAILRTLSKAHALAGARVGALLATPALIELAKRVIPPYSLAQPTVEAALRALDPAELAASARAARGLLAERDYLAQRTRGFAVGGQGLAERRQFPADRLPRRRPLHEQHLGRRLDRARLARAIRHCRARCASRWAPARRTMRCFTA